ncbi:4'-phosphopantetheinyl transferase family protein [Bacillus sp. S10(2024)]|uniref:4'-phosphopantetheinyl transferase family protein n=1 Tax=Bacillus sp. S10(2024) TaxID=3162886 RepID=UPI003D1CFEEF
MAEPIEEEAFYHYLQLFPKYQQSKIARYVSKEDRDRALIGALLVRTIARDECNVSFHEIDIAETSLGKPYFLVPKGFYFNISHAGKFVVCVFDTEKVGIDVEQIQPIDIEHVCRFFALPERQLLSMLQGNEKLERFYDLWTLKESYIKALGKGLSIPLDSFSINMTPTSITVHEKGVIQAWHFKQYSIHEEYKLSVCVSHSDFPQKIRIHTIHDFLQNCIS